MESSRRQKILQNLTPKNTRNNPEKAMNSAMLFRESQKFHNVSEALYLNACVGEGLSEDFTKFDPEELPQQSRKGNEFSNAFPRVLKIPQCFRGP
jgi:hypothetical protein